MNTKQVIVIRKDLNMRKGKMCAQASHASMSFLTRHGVVGEVFHGPCFINIELGNKFLGEVEHWLENSFRKIVVCVNSEEDLDAIHQKALDNGLTSHLIIDNGLTEFNNVPTKTCCAIGPHWDDKFIGITEHLPLI